MTATAFEPCVEITHGESVPPNPGSALRLVVILDGEAISALREPWNQLAGHHPFLRWEWIASWWQTYGAARQAAILTVRDEHGRWVGLFPLQIERRPLWGRVLSNMANGRACSDHVRPIIAAGFERAVMHLMADWISEQAALGKFNLIDLDGVDGADPFVERLLSELSLSGMTRRDSEIEGSWIAELPGDWTEFERKTKKCFRRKLQKARRNQALPAVDIVTVDSAALLAEHWPTLIRLHEARRDEKDQLGCFQEPGFGEFLLQAASRMAECGDAVLLLAHLDNKPFAAMLLFLAHEKAFMYQSGYDPAQRQLEPGHLMAACAVQYSIARQCTQFDFLRGDEPYKARWNTVRQPMIRIRLVPNRWLARLRLWLSTKQRFIKARLRREKSNLERHESEDNEGSVSTPSVRTNQVFVR